MKVIIIAPQQCALKEIPKYNLYHVHAVSIATAHACEEELLEP